MADYKGIKGGKVQNFSTNPPAPILGQVWYNETTRTLNYHAAAAGAWASGRNLNTGRFYHSGSGVQTSSIVAAGEIPGPRAIAESYNGSSWTEVADLNTGRQSAAQAGISGLVGTAAPFLAEAFDIYERGGEKFTPEVAKEYMSPYQRAVTDIEKREAQTQFERTARPAFEKRAVDAGGMSGLGTRAGVEAAEMQRGQSQLLADIEAKGLQSAFQNAQQQFAQQKAREQQMAGNIGRTGPALFQAGLAERGAQMGVGEQKREAAQSELDEAYFKFLLVTI